jgi:hypothetical protein
MILDSYTHFGSCEPLVVEESTGKTQAVSTYVLPATIMYEIMIGASQMGGHIVSDGRGYTYRIKRDYPRSRVWKCTFYGCVKCQL